MQLVKKINKYILIIFLLIIIIITYNFRFEIIFTTLSAFGYDDKIAKRYSFSISERPIQIIKNRFNNILYAQKSGEEELNISLKIKKGFADYKSENLEFVGGNYYLNIIDSTKIDKSMQKLQYSNEWQNNKPAKVWSLDMSSKNILDQNSGEKSSAMIVEAKPKICGSNLIYAKQDGNIGAVNFRTGKRVWYKKYGEISSSGWPRLRGFTCYFDKELGVDIILLPSAEGVFCINSNDGSLLNSRCKKGKLGVYESRVSPRILNNIVYVATINPSAVQAFDYLSGKVLWHKELIGANPWNNFTIDKERGLIFVNMGSPNRYFIIDNSNKYKYSGSLIALNLKNGKIIWQFQEHLKDSWNHDFVGQPILSPKKINQKDIVITFSKSGSIYFLNRDDGKPVLSVKNEVINLGDFQYSFKKSIVPKALLDSNYYDFFGKNCIDCAPNTKLFGPLPPVIKYERFYDGNNGGLQWPGASIDTLNNLLILASKHHDIYREYSDFVPNPLVSFPKNSQVQKCTSCHDSKGAVKGLTDVNETIVPSLFLSTKIYDSDSLKNYIKNNSFHKNMNLNDGEFEKIYKDLNNYDETLIKNKQYLYISKGNKIDIKNKNILSKIGPMGKITAISLDTGKVVWQIPAGTQMMKDFQLIIGSKNFGAITNGGNNEGVSFFTGSFDKKIYAFNNKDGKYLWDSDLPASGTAWPLVHNISSERWIFVIATGGRVPGDQADSIIAFRQNLNN